MHLSLSLYRLTFHVYFKELNVSFCFLFCSYLAMNTTLRTSDFMFQISDFCIRSSFHLSEQVGQLVLAAQSVVGTPLSLATKAAGPNELPFTQGKDPQMMAFWWA